MAVRFVLSDYVAQSLALASYDKLEDGTFVGRTEALKGVIAFGETLPQCRDELQSTLEDWLLTGLELGHPIPLVAGIDLNRMAA